MNEQTLDHCARRIIKWFLDNKTPYALVGGIAVSFRTVERSTLDLDFAVAVASDAEAETLLLSLRSSGFSVVTAVEQKSVSRLATARLIQPENQSVFVDLLFASSGIESEIVQSAEEIEIFPAVSAKVASIATLIAMKVLSANDAIRIRDISDLMALFAVASTKDLEKARDLLGLIQSRGYHRGKDLSKELDQYLLRFSQSEP